MTSFKAARWYSGPSRFLFCLGLLLLLPAPGGKAQELPSVPPPAGPGLGEGQTLPIPFVDFTLRSSEGNSETALSLQLLLLLTVLSLAPSLVVLMTSFLRIAIVLDFVKRALSLQQVPPNTVIMGIALFLTLFIMFPTFTRIYEDAFRPYAEGELSTREMVDQAQAPLRYFMYRQMSKDTGNITLFMRLRGLGKPQSFADVPTYIVIPAFILHELTVAFKIGILLYVPFIIIDMVVASVLMSMGMIMLPPIMISMPFKLILFVLVDGWTLLTRQIVMSFL